MKKAFDQTVRDIKREVNKKVLKVPSVEQKVLDATSNEPWGPHGSHLADIAQATRNYHEYQMIMSVIWKRINDTGKNWRHVYKALTVLDYLVAHGSERIIDEIREHAYQISTLSDFQYIDSGGRDQGSNVRKKSQSLVVLINDKDRIQEVRQKGAANREKYRNTSGGGMHKPGSYDDDRYGSRDEERGGYGREKDGYADSYGRDTDRYGEERYGRDGSRDDDYRGRSRSVDNYNYGSRSRSSDRERERAYEDDSQFSSRGSGVKADDRSLDGSVAGRPLERKFSEQNLDAPPSYEEAVGGGHSPVNGERDGETSAAVASPPAPVNPNHQATTGPSTPSPAPAPAPAPAKQEGDSFDEFDPFDPRGAFSAAPPTSNGAELDLLGGLSDSFSNSLALVPVSAETTTTEFDAAANSGAGHTFAASGPTFSNQSLDDPFGDGPFRAVPSTNGVPSVTSATSSFHSSRDQMSQPSAHQDMGARNFGFGDTFDDLTYAPPPSTLQPQYSSDNAEDILADIFPNSGPPQSGGFPPQQPTPQEVFPSHSGFPAQASQNQPGFPPQSGQFPSQMGPASYMGQQNPNFYENYNPSPQFVPQSNPTPQYVPQSNPTPQFVPQSNPTPQYVPPSNPTNGSQMAFQPTTPHPDSLALVPQQPAKKDKFETKSTVWADTLNRGLVNLNISGSKTNPLANIGVDFDAINRKEKRMEKPSLNNTAPVTSNISMGKAMGSGSGMGRAGAGAIRPAPPNPGMGMGMGMGGMGMGPMGGGYGVNQQQPMGMGMGQGGQMGMGMGQGGQMGMGMGMGQGGPMMQRPPGGFPPGYNPMMGAGGYGQQQPYGGGYR